MKSVHRIFSVYLSLSVNSSMESNKKPMIICYDEKSVWGLFISSHHIHSNRNLKSKHTSSWNQSTFHTVQIRWDCLTLWHVWALIDDYINLLCFALLGNKIKEEKCNVNIEIQWTVYSPIDPSQCCCLAECLISLMSYTLIVIIRNCSMLKFVTRTDNNK